jgi:hypothetical protein
LSHATTPGASRRLTGFVGAMLSSVTDDASHRITISLDNEQGALS